MLPNPYNDPACPPKEPTVSCIPLHVASDLAFPLFGQLHPPMVEAPTVPEIAINKHRDPQLTNDEVRSPRQVTGMNLIVNAHVVQHGGYGEFRLCVPPSDPGHHSAALLGRHDVPAVLALCARIGHCWD